MKNKFLMCMLIFLCSACASKQTQSDPERYSKQYLIPVSVTKLVNVIKIYADEEFGGYKIKERKLSSYPGLNMKQLLFNEKIYYSDKEKHKKDCNVYVYEKIRQEISAVLFVSCESYIYESGFGRGGAHNIFDSSNWTSDWQPENSKLITISVIDALLLKLKINKSSIKEITIEEYSKQ